MHDEQCEWIELGKKRRGMGYEQCPGLTMTRVNGVNLCQYHFRLWNQYDIARRESEGEVDPWSEDEETRFEPK